MDEYCLFYLQWIFPLRRQIQDEVDLDFWMAQFQTPKWRTWSGYAFEAVCLKHVSQIRKALRIPAGALSGSWSSSFDKMPKVPQGAQIDLLFDRPDGVMTIVEIKFTQKPFQIDKNYAANLQKKMDVLKAVTKTHKQIFLTLAAPQGIKQNQYAMEMIRGVIMLDDMFA